MRGGYLLMPSHVTTSNHQHISHLQLRSLPRQTLLHLFYLNLMPRNWTRRLPLRFLIPPQPITQYAPPHYPTSLAPIMYSIPLTLPSLVVREAIVVHFTCLMCEMFQAVPLRTGLRVDADFVVHGAERREVGEIDSLLGEGFAAEPWELHVVERPVKLNVLARGNFAGGGEDNRGG
jgi:hypothetical protein